MSKILTMSVPGSTNSSFPGALITTLLSSPLSRNDLCACAKFAIKAERTAAKRAHHLLLNITVLLLAHSTYECHFSFNSIT